MAGATGSRFFAFREAFFTGYLHAFFTDLTFAFYNVVAEYILGML